jgi:hypothetical protein
MLFDKIFLSGSSIYGIKPYYRGKNMNVVILGMDSETCNGAPICFSLYSDDIKNMSKIFWVNKYNATKKFFSILNQLPSNGFIYIIYGFNLQFDIISYFWDKKFEYFLNHKVDFYYDDYHVTGIYANVQFLTFYHKNSAKTIYLIDGFSFFPTSLQKIEHDILSLNLPKLKHPKDLGKTKFNSSDKYFCRYAMRDAEIAYYLGKRIHELHIEYDISQCVSRANMAGKIFRRKYVKKLIPQISKPLMFASLHSYHGGKNGLYCEKLSEYRNIWAADIISAYPAAMYNFPSFYNKNLYYEISGKECCKLLPNFGIYKISGEVKSCKWPGFYPNSNSTIFRSLLKNSEIKNYWTTGYELNCMLRLKELKITNIYGYFYDYLNDNEISPWRKFANDFFIKKNNATNKLYREFYKVILNSLYGKTIELNSLSTDNELGFDLINNELIFNDSRKAGILFNPFIASLITGWCRAKIHELEHKYKSIHTSTDGIICLTKPKEVKGLGGISVEKIDLILIIRNKLYIIYTLDKNLALKINDKCVDSSIYPDYYIKKYAHHGFHGDIFELEKLIKKGRKKGSFDDITYKYKHVNKLKESFRRNLTPNLFCDIRGKVYL